MKKDNAIRLVLLGLAMSAITALAVITTFILKEGLPVIFRHGLGAFLFGTDKGVLVVRAPKSGALQLLEGDVIQSIGGREPRSGAHATRILASYQPGESVSIKVLRKRSTVDLGAKLPE